ILEVEDVEVVVRDDEIRVDVFRSSGPGGQGVNTADSAVRITHLPTGIVVSCQNERSQLRNRDTALRVLRARLFQLADAKQKADLEKLTGDKKDIAFGSQIRSYIFAPYQLIKDHRTNLEVGNVAAGRDGEIAPFSGAYFLGRSKRADGGGWARGRGQRGRGRPAPRSARATAGAPGGGSGRSAHRRRAGAAPPREAGGPP